MKGTSIDWRRDDDVWLYATLSGAPRGSLPPRSTIDERADAGRG